MKKKIRVAVVFGGRSAEHEVSLVSAANIIHELNRKKYEIVPIGITHEGRWFVHDQALDMLKEGNIHAKLLAIPSTDPKMHDILIAEKTDHKNLPVLDKHEKIDVIFPVLHGTFGEDGTIQGLFELMDVPYVGAGVLGSAVGMDKVVQKKLFSAYDLPVVNFLHYTLQNNPIKNQKEILYIENYLCYPIFVKPANLGSSVGINKAHNRAELLMAIEEAFTYDRKILLEQGIENAREIEISVLGNDNPRVSVPGEIKPCREFYDYRAKYEDESSALEIPAPISKELTAQVQSIALRAYKAVDCSGMARVDFLLSAQGKLFLSELNTIPGFTKISMYPKLWAAAGLPYTKLLDELIALAIARYKEKKSLTTHAKTLSDWYKKT